MELETFMKLIANSRSVLVTGPTSVCTILSFLPLQSSWLFNSCYSDAFQGCHCHWIDFLFEPAHEIVALFFLHILIVQMRMHSHPVGLDVWFSVRPIVYLHTSCVRTAKALARLRGCAGLPEPSLVACVISTIISWAGSFWSLQHISGKEMYFTDMSNHCAKQQ